MPSTVEEVLNEIDAIRGSIYSENLPEHVVEILNRYENLLRALPIKI